MARPREFEPTEALRKAMLLFWQQGFVATSLDDLVQATGVSRYGFYSTFGDKHALFIKALEHYAATVITGMLGPLETPTAARAEIRAYFAALLSQAQSASAQSGCLIGNTAMELPHADGLIAAIIDQHFARMRAAFLNALQHAIQHGEVTTIADPAAYADYLVGVAMAYLVYVRAAMPAQALQHFIQVALAALD